MTRLSRVATPVLAAAILAITLVGCTAPSTESKPSKTHAAEAPSKAPSEAPAAPAGDFVTAKFANPVTNPGDLLTTITGKNFRVDVYQVKVTPATKTGNFADPDTSKPIIAVGADVVYVNYVVTNTGSADIPLSFSVVDIDARYADWKYLQGMDSITDLALEKSLNLNNSALAPNGGDSPFIWAPGTSFSYDQNFLYQAGSEITFKARLTPAKANGDLDHDATEEATATTKIK